MSNLRPLDPSFHAARFAATANPGSREGVVLRGGDRVAIRPIQIGDIELERSFIEGPVPDVSSLSLP
jgi:hypothetical protein